MKTIATILALWLGTGAVAQAAPEQDANNSVAEALIEALERATREAGEPVRERERADVPRHKCNGRVCILLDEERPQARPQRQ